VNLTHLKYAANVVNYVYVEKVNGAMKRYMAMFDELQRKKTEICD
jgi:hypothetical protein